MKLNWKILRLALIPALALLGAGCGGLQASHSISPATFLLPGLMQADPPAAQPDQARPAAEPCRELAQF
ncbi:MAG: hypothetical protein ABSF95_22395 [Verrucomicrobiota bacterium]